MSKFFQIVSGIAVVSFPVAITYMVEPNVFEKSIDVLALYLVALLLFLALGNGMFDRYVLRFVKTEEVRTLLVRVGIGGVLFSLTFISVLLYRV